MAIIWRGAQGIADALILVLHPRPGIVVIEAGHEIAEIVRCIVRIRRQPRAVTIVCVNLNSPLVAKRITNALVVEPKSSLVVVLGNDIANSIVRIFGACCADVVEGRSAANGPAAGLRAGRGPGRRLPRRLRRGLQ